MRRETDLDPHEANSSRLICNNSYNEKKMSFSNSWARCSYLFFALVSEQLEKELLWEPQQPLLLQPQSAIQMTMYTFHSPRPQPHPPGRCVPAHLLSLCQAQ